ncbi:MAG: amino acid aldolase [Nostocoides sp.]
MTRHRRRITAGDKGFPTEAIGLTIADYLATSPTIDTWSTPLVLLHQGLMEQNADTLQRWADMYGFEYMPHGKTTMAPALWWHQINLGATGITLATPSHLRVAHAHGIPQVQLANALLDPGALLWAQERVENGWELWVWADSEAVIDHMETVLGPRSHRIGVLVERGTTGGRTGARTHNQAQSIAQRISMSRSVDLVGVAGYEGAAGHSRSGADIDAVRRYCDELVHLFDLVHDQCAQPRPVLSAGGSAYPDIVADAFADLRQRSPLARLVLRSGAALTHDDGFYAGISPLATSDNPYRLPALYAATRGRARVVSRPEPGLAILDAGKRDLPYDEGLPHAVGFSAHVSAMNDQHAFLRGSFPDDAVQVGDCIDLGLSHPCTTFDKWRLIPAVASWDSDAPVVDVVETYF